MTNPFRFIAATVRRYAVLWGYFLRFSLSRSMEFRLDLVFRVIMDIVYGAMIIAFFEVMFLHTDTLGGWNREQVRIFIGVHMVIDSLCMILWNDNLHGLPALVNRGDLDSYLVRPVSTFFFVTLRQVAATSILNLIVSIGVFVWAYSISSIPFHAGALAGLGMMMCFGVALNYLLRALFALPVFWTHSVEGFMHLYHACMGVADRPDGLFAGWVRRLVCGVLPFAVIASFPARAFFEGFPGPLLLHFFGVITIFALIVRMQWRMGLRAYSSASS